MSEQQKQSLQNSEKEISVVNELLSLWCHVRESNLDGRRQELFR